MSDRLNTSENGTLERTQNTLTAHDLQTQIQADAKQLLSVSVAGDQEPEEARLLRAARVMPSDQIEEPPACLAFEVSGESFTVGTPGNISTVTGKPKAKKTFAVSIAVAAAVCGQLVINRVRGQLPEGKQIVLLFDTEQARHHVLRVVQRICRLCNIDNPDNLIVYSLRPFSPNDRLKLVDYAINNTPGVGLVVIDGIRDLAVDPVMDSEQASVIMTHLLQWSDRLHIHILCVLHQNKSDTNLRGCLGTELSNKSETVLSVARDQTDKNISIVSPEYCRGKEFEPFAFTIDEQGLPVLVDEVPTNPSDARRGKRLGVDDLKIDEIESMLRHAFDQVEQLRYAELRTNLMEASERVGRSLGKSKVEVLIRRIEKEGYLSKHKPPKARCDVYQIIKEKLPVQPS